MTDTARATATPLEFWFDFGSNYSYLSAMRIEAMAADYGVALAWKPFLLGPIFTSLGWEHSPFLLQKQKGAYVWRDMQRLCAKFGLPWQQPSVFPRRALLPLRIAVLGADAAWLPLFCRAVFQRNFVADQDIDDEAAITDVLSSLGLPAAQLIAAAASADIKRRLRLQTEQAALRGLFGAPTFFVGDEMFWGNDRLDDALAYAARR